MNVVKRLSASLTLLRGIALRMEEVLNPNIRIGLEILDH